MTASSLVDSWNSYAEIDAQTTDNWDDFAPGEWSAPWNKIQNAGIASNESIIYVGGGSYWGALDMANAARCQSKQWWIDFLTDEGDGGNAPQLSASRKMPKDGLDLP